MTYRAVRRFTASGVTYEPGAMVPAAAVPARTLNILLNMRRLVPVDAPSAAPAAPRVRARRHRAVAAREG